MGFSGFVSTVSVRCGTCRGDVARGRAVGSGAVGCSGAYGVGVGRMLKEDWAASYGDHGAELLSARLAREKT